jgi:hypothetical protein
MQEEYIRGSLSRPGWAKIVRPYQKIAKGKKNKKLTQMVEGLLSKGLP